MVRHLCRQAQLNLEVSSMQKQLCSGLQGSGCVEKLSEAGIGAALLGHGLWIMSVGRTLWHMCVCMLLPWECGARVTSLL